MLGDTSDWTLREATSIRSLQNGGTFKNVLGRRLDNVITPIFTHILAFVDTNRNLQLLHPDRNDNTSPIVRLWLGLFSCQDMFNQFHYQDMVGNKKVAVVNNYECQFPFSWLVKESIDVLILRFKDLEGLFH